LNEFVGLHFRELAGLNQNFGAAVAIANPSIFHDQAPGPVGPAWGRCAS